MVGMRDEDNKCPSLKAPQKPARKKEEKVKRGKTFDWKGYMAGAALVTGATILGKLVHNFLAPTNLVMIYLLAVVVAALRLGLKPAIATAFLSVVAFDFFLVPPHHTLVVADTEYLITFAALFTVGVVISSLVSKARERAEAVREREVQTSALYYLSRDLAAAADVATIKGAVFRNIGESLGAEVAVLLPEGERLTVQGTGGLPTLNEKELAVADWAFCNRQAAGCGTEIFGSADLLCLLLQTSGNVTGVMGVRLKHQADYRNPQVRRLLDAFATQTAMALERVQLARQAEQAQILQARENLERALLNSISHDLRTPLVSITGALSTLRTEGYSLHEKGRRELVDGAWEEAGRLNRFVGNLLDMTRVESGELKLKKELSDIQDLIGCGLAPLDQRLQERKVNIGLADDLPLVQMDMVLMTQVLVNLVDNAIKYSPPGTPVDISAHADDEHIMISVEDRGPGVPHDDLKRIFQKFFRIPVPEGAGGTGLGLSICKGIVEAHGGSIRAENREGGGLRVTVTVPQK